jgi:hypothetical protein
MAQIVSIFGDFPLAIGVAGFLWLRKPVGQALPPAILQFGN